jgi:hypothetical protein
MNLKFLGFVITISFIFSKIIEVFPINGSKSYTLEIQNNKNFDELMLRSDITFIDKTNYK